VIARHAEGYAAFLIPSTADPQLSRITLAAGLVVALLTPNAAISPTVQQEIGAALQLKKPIIPLFADGVEVARFPFLAEIEYVKISTDDLLLPCVLTVR